MTTSTQQLLGQWISDSAGKNSKNIEKTRVEFRDNGVLEFTIIDGTSRCTLLKYNTDGSVLTAMQPPDSGKRRVPFTFTPDGKLQLEVGDRVLLYKRM
jgi:hypothetical protein